MDRAVLEAKIIDTFYVQSARTDLIQGNNMIQLHNLLQPSRRSNYSLDFRGRIQVKEIKVDPTILGSIIAALGAVVGAVGGTIIQLVHGRIRRDKGVLRGTIDQLITTIETSNSSSVLQKNLPNAREVIMCGWSLARIIDENRRQLRDFVHQGGNLRVLLLDPGCNAVSYLDSFITDTDSVHRRSQGWPKIVSTNITKSDILRTINILKESGIIKAESLSLEMVRLSNSFLPFGILMVELKDGSGWASVQIYPLHPDAHFDQRLAFTLGNNKSGLWRILKEQFDLAWEDPNFSHSMEP